MPGATADTEACSLNYLVTFGAQSVGEGGLAMDVIAGRTTVVCAHIEGIAAVLAAGIAVPACGEALE